MTVLSVNLNKLALLRNSRGRNFPDLLDFAGRFIALGVGGITVHPRPDERHIHYQDARDLAAFLRDRPVEFNIEGYPSESFMQLIEETRPDQCTLVPDAPDQLTSDHGWDFHTRMDEVSNAVSRLRRCGVRSSVFLDPDPQQAMLAAESGADRIELYTEKYASCFHTGEREQVWQTYRDTATAAQDAGLGVNAGHDLDLENLSLFLTIADILEVSIGHALVIECIEQGMKTVIARYLGVCEGATHR